MGIFNNLFNRRKKEQQPAVGTNLINTGRTKVEDFARLIPGDRMRIVMRTGDAATVNMGDFALFQYAILSDPDLHVTFAALKRIHRFGEHPEVMPMMLALQQENNIKLEPYLSMALHRLGIISTAELEQKLNRS